MRVITGSAKGRKLLSPQGERVRPTTDRIKEALFNIIGENIKNSILIDCFAGTGNIGVEALSRGAKKCYFIDNDFKSIEIIHNNLELTNLKKNAIIMNSNVSNALKKIEIKKEKVDFVFLDPPYLQEYINPTMKSLSENNILKQNNWIIIEHSKKEHLEEQYGKIKCFRQQVYGNTSLSFYTKEENTI